MRSDYDVAVIGSGPAGLAAATEAAEHGLTTVLIDEQQTAGGQIYRNIEHSPLASTDMLGPDYQRGHSLVQAFRRQPIDYLTDTQVWVLTRDREIGLVRNGKVRFLRATQVILATGAQERPCPIPGWTLPGVMTAGAGQVLLKSAGLVPENPVVLAGSGPLLLLIAWQYLQAGARIAALLDTTPRANYLSALRYLPAALGAFEYLVKGLGLMKDIRRAGVTLVGEVEAISALGGDRLQAVEYLRNGRKTRLDTELLLLHQGVVPNVQITRSLGCQHLWDDQQLCWRPQTDSWGGTDVDGIAVAGDGAGIGGAMVAECLGRLTAMEAARRQGRLGMAERERRASGELKRARRHRRIRPFLDALYRPTDAFRRPSDETIVCRCEEVTAGQVREMVELGCIGPNQTKSFTRCGMGPCQGRMCGLTVSELIADARGVQTSEVGYYRIRPPIRPITLGELAASDVDAGLTGTQR